MRVGQKTFDPQRIKTTERIELKDKQTNSLRETKPGIKLPRREINMTYKMSNI